MVAFTTDGNTGSDFGRDGPRWHLGPTAQFGPQVHDSGPEVRFSAGFKAFGGLLACYPTFKARTPDGYSEGFRVLFNMDLPHATHPSNGQVTEKT